MLKVILRIPFAHQKEDNYKINLSVYTNLYQIESKYALIVITCMVLVVFH